MVLADRARIRKLDGHDALAEETSLAADPCHEAGRHLQEVPDVKDGKESRALPLETLAIVVTAGLGLLSYVFQAKLARDHTHAEMEHDRRLAEQEKAAAFAYTSTLILTCQSVFTDLNMVSRQ